MSRKTINHMYWADEFAESIIKSGNYKPYWVDDMKTPSGRVHIGSVRAVVTHDLVYRALRDRGVDATFSYVLEDHDPMDGLPIYVDQKEYTQHLGKPLFQIPSPEPGFASYGARWGEEYKEIFNSIGVHPQVIWGSKLYLSGKMNDMIRVCLDNADKISDIYERLYKKRRPKNWFPFSPVCERCGKMSTTATTDWDGEQITYECRLDGLDWTKGCGHQTKTSPFSTLDHYAGKMPWKVEWPCKWKVIGVTVEGAGKDHMSQGSSHDFAKQMCEQVINYPIPFHFAHEFFLIGGRKMSSSKGLGSSAKEITEIIPPALIRFMIARVKYNRAINFDPTGDTISDLYDAFDESARAYWDQSNTNLARIFELSQVSGKPPAAHFQPRFRDVAKFVQNPKINIQEEFERTKGSKLNQLESQVLSDRIAIAKNWLKDYAPKDQVFTITPEVPEQAAQLSSEQKEYLKKITTLLEKDWSDAEELQQTLYQTGKDMGLSTKDAFGSIYSALLGKSHGPKAAWLLLENKDKTIERFKQLSEA